VYRLESPQYGKPSLTTLKRLASIFDVGLSVLFAPVSKLVDRVTSLSTEDILVPSFEDDARLHERVAASGDVQTTINKVHDTIRLARSSLRIHIRPKATNPYSENLELDFGPAIPNQDEVHVQLKITDISRKGEIK
jgi:hypothetical protein